VQCLSRHFRIAMRISGLCCAGAVTLAAALLKDTALAAAIGSLDTRANDRKLA